jgi:hypothetical protein
MQWERMEEKRRRDWREEEKKRIPIEGIYGEDGRREE